MTTLRVNTPFGTRLFPTDLLFKNFFDQASTFETNLDKKINHPVDIMYTEEALIFEISPLQNPLIIFDFPFLYFSLSMDT